MRNFLFSLSLVASITLGALASDSSELKIDVTLPVECDRKTQKGDTIQVHYRGTLASNGNKFDASYDRGTPFSFTLGGGQVIKGTLTVPPDFGYGNRAVGPIPAGSTLVFETELMGIRGVPNPESIVTKASSSASSASETASSKVVERVASKIEEAAEAVKTVIADTDDTQEHNEL
ncbi:hypothetical protein ABKA04_008279 [Annulohypoxylon sp. FPYF3050]